MSVGRALADGGYRPGDTVIVPLREVVKPLARDARLEALEPRGFA
jgi:hypothetical protein